MATKVPAPTADATAQAPADTAAVPPAAPEALPTTGGCWLRNPDGTLSPDTTAQAAQPE